MSATRFSERRAAFRKLHESGCFALPNPWDVGSARYLQGLGFQALATTSSGFAFSHGLPDGENGASRDLMLRHIAEIVAATDLPVNADFQSGYAVEPDGVAKNAALCVETGVAGFSIEDRTGDPNHPLHDLAFSVERIKAARAAIDQTSSGVLLTARAECYLVAHPDPLRESIRRLQAYAEAGADVLYAPGVRDPKEIRAIVDAVRPKPVNVLVVNLGLNMSDLAELGARRVSVGSSLARRAWTGFIRAAKAIAEEGSFAGFEGNVSGGELNDFFRKDANQRQSR